MRVTFGVTASVWLTLEAFGTVQSAQAPGLRGTSSPTHYVAPPLATLERSHRRSFATDKFMSYKGQRVKTGPHAMYMRPLAPSHTLLIKTW